MKTEEIHVEHIPPCLGSDLDVVDAARVSFDKKSEWEYDYKDVDISDGYACPPQWEKMPVHSSKRLSAADAKLINYLAKHKHWSPFAHTSIKFRITAPIFVARQLVKHQVGAAWNEVSRRYVDAEPTFYMPKEWRSRPDASIKQGSGAGTINRITHVHTDDPDVLNSISPTPTGEYVDYFIDRQLHLYKTLLSNNVAPEQARMILPQNMMTSWIWTGSLYFFARVCKERLDPHAQQETREVAQFINDECAKLFPVSWKALEENR